MLCIVLEKVWFAEQYATSEMFRVRDFSTLGSSGTLPSDCTMPSCSNRHKWSPSIIIIELV